VRQPDFDHHVWQDCGGLAVPGFPKHLVFYRYLAEEDTLRVVHVLHGARNLEVLLDAGE
jgi:plasmid stabilization system protein ParE